jgi:hypothetical protein
MLKCSSLLKTNLKGVLSKKFHYQKEILTKIGNDVDSASSKLLQEEINRLNQKVLLQPNLYRFIDAYRQYGYKVSGFDADQEPSDALFESFSEKSHRPVEPE